ncbi:YqaA family protein [Marinicauda sp. Alg238-R41]|uniref:YqaA family protein n=1 Tax=Marinicauda sp. Alg238-R41 TaxID=2993447 RepID=UPI0022DF0A33|nr:VTT domain-containing protein [Marinicauda sp. Alg238-R41]
MRKEVARRSCFRRRLRVWRWRMGRAARRGWALPALFFGSFLESAIFPWPIEFPLLAEMLRGRKHVFPAALATALGSAAGAMAVFAIAGIAAGLVEAWVTARPEFASDLDEVRARLELRGGLAVFVAMLTPVPVQLTSLAAGFAGLSAPVFALAVLCGRCLRFAAMAVLVFFYGERLMEWWRARPTPWRHLATGFFVALFLVALAASLWL